MQRYAGVRIVIQKGLFLTGTLYMKSNVELHIDVTAALIGSSDMNDYSKDTRKQLYRYEAHMDRCLIYSYGAENIAFTGSTFASKSAGR